MNSRDITLWLDERWYKALEQHLPNRSVEDALNDHLDQLIDQLPESVYDRISREIQQEKLESRAEQEAARRFAVFHINENGTEQYLQVERLDFDRQWFSALSITDGWKVFSMKDVSTAAYRADRKEYLPSEQRWRRFLDALDGKELTHGSLSMTLSGSRRLLPEEVSFEDEISEIDTRLNFTLKQNLMDSQKSADYPYQT